MVAHAPSVQTVQAERSEVQRLFQLRSNSKPAWDIYKTLSQASRQAEVRQTLNYCVTRLPLGDAAQLRVVRLWSKVDKGRKERETMV